MNRTKRCPFCNAESVCLWSTKTLYACNTVVNDDPLGTGQSSDCLEAERDKLKAMLSHLTSAADTSVTLSLITPCSFDSPAPSPSWTTTATVTRVVDGDTVDVEIRRVIRVRLLDCWAPEAKQDSRVQEADRDAAKQAGIASKEHLTALAQGKTAVVQVPLDESGEVAKAITLGRVLGNVWLEERPDESLSEIQVRTGHATKERTL